MATDGAKAPAEEEAVVDDGWQFLPSPNSPPSLHLPPSSSSSTPWDTNEGITGGGDDFLQLQRRSSSSVVPPPRHEGLGCPPPPPKPDSPPASSTRSPPLSSSSSPSRPSGTTEDEPLSPPLRSHPSAGIFRSGLHGIASRVRHGVLLAGGFRSFGSAAAAAAGVAAAVLLWFACVRMQRMRWRWWRRVPVEASENRLLLLIREKDQKINQLMLQIAQMNELMLARRRVQVLRVGS